MTPQPLWFLMSYNHVDFDGLTYLLFSSSSGAYTLSASSDTGFPVQWEGFDGGIPLRAKCSKVSHTLSNMWLWVSIFVPICCHRKHHRWNLKRALNYEYSQMSVSVILSLQFFFFLRPIPFYFPLGYIISSTIHQGHPRIIRYELHLPKWAISYIRYLVVISKSFVSILYLI